MKSRIQWLDFAKGIGIFLMILGHMPSLPILFREWIFSFHMPLFFFLSGYVFKEQDIAGKFKKTIRQILYPYLLYSIICTAIDFLLFRDIVAMKESAWLTVSGQGGFGILWFFFSLFLVQNVYNAICRLRYKYILIFVILIVGYVMTLFHIGEFWKLSTSMVALGFFAVGEYIGKEKREEFRRTSLLVCSAAMLMINILFAGLNLHFFDKTMDVNNGIYGCLLFSFPAAISGTLFICALAQLLSMYLPKLIINLVAYTGANSRDFYPLTMYVPLRIVAVCELAAIPVGGILKMGTKIVGFIVAFVLVEVKKRFCEWRS